MASFNTVVLLGNLTRDVDLRTLPNGTVVGSSGIAVNSKYKDSSGAQREDVMFIDLTFWGRTAEIAEQYLSKGSEVLIEGALKLETWEKDGQKRSKHSVKVSTMQMLGKKGVNSPAGKSDQSSQSSSSGSNSGATDGNHGSNVQDDIPF